MRSLRFLLFALGTACGLVLAAERADAADAKVSGTVSFEGKPLAAGKIVFHLADGQFVGCKVKDGKYALDRVPTGEWVVTVEGEKLPPKYGKEETTPLRVRIKEDTRELNWELTK
jgi:hypothetical protein